MRVALLFSVLLLSTVCVFGQTTINFAGLLQGVNTGSAAAPAADCPVPITTFSVNSISAQKDFVSIGVIPALINAYNNSLPTVDFLAAVNGQLDTNAILADGSDYVDFSITTRAPTAAEVASFPDFAGHTNQIAQGAVIAIFNDGTGSEAPLSITQAQLATLFSPPDTSLSTIVTGQGLPSGTTTVVDRPGTDTKTLWDSYTGVSVYQATSIETLTNGFDVLAYVQSHPNSFGYVSYYVASLATGVRKISINGIAPSAANVKSGAYPVTRGVYINQAGTPDQFQSGFRAFLGSPAGEAVVAQFWVPIGLSEQ